MSQKGLFRVIPPDAVTQGSLVHVFVPLWPHRDTTVKSWPAFKGEQRSVQMMHLCAVVV